MGIIVVLPAAAWATHRAVVAFATDAETRSRLTVVWISLFLVFLLQTFVTLPAALTYQHSNSAHSSPGAAARFLACAPRPLPRRCCALPPQDAIPPGGEPPEFLARAR
ncbi:hypothetical protein [Streptomyces sp. NPDC057889]|uniref:hypothetical protein n=2 Tax=unclassified Streptomyces TaxID=2593676 RepID=UPI0036966AF4